MTSRRDTLPDPPRELSSDTDPGAAPIGVIFQKIAERDQVVPRSVEQGESYQAVHAPASPRPALLEPPVVVDVQTDPIPRVIEAPAPRRSIVPAALVLAGLLLIVVAEAVLVLSRR